jgi:hypothetical protein
VRIDSIESLLSFKKKRETHSLTFMSKKTFKLVLKPKRNPSSNDNSASVVVPAQDSISIDLRGKLAKELTDERYECMICYDKVKRKDRIWSCDVCWACFHMKCIKDWSRTSTSNVSLQEIHENKGWRW